MRAPSVRALSSLRNASSQLNGIVVAIERHALGRQPEPVDVGGDGERRDDEGDDRRPEREQLEAVEPEGQADPVEALAASCRLPAAATIAAAVRGLRAAAR